MCKFVNYIQQVHRLRQGRGVEAREAGRLGSRKPGWWGKLDRLCALGETWSGYGQDQAWVGVGMRVWKDGDLFWSGSGGQGGVRT